MKLPIVVLSLLCAGTLLLSARAQGSGGVTPIPPARAALMLKAPADMDRQSAAVLLRASKAYGKLQSLRSVIRTPQTVTIARMRRPRYYHYLQQKPSGELIALAVSDGKRYYEYTERTRQYIERDAAMLSRLTLPTHARLFFPGQTVDGTMLGLGGQPVARDYAFGYAGQHTVNGRKADAIRVSTLVQTARNAWSSFESTRYYDAQNGLLIRTVKGKTATDVKNEPNAALPTENFRWQPIPDATKGFG